MGLFSRFFQKKLLDTSLLHGASDIHCHILPGVDDGIQTEADALKALAIYKKLGYQRVVFTPHIMGEYPKNDANYLTERFRAFQELTPQGLELKLAAEYMLDDHFLDHIQNPILSFDGKHVLVETSYWAPSPIMDTQLYQLRLKGYEPILAHPERYVYMDDKKYDQLKKEGLLFQLNLFSLMGAYGDSAKRKAEKLLEKGYYNFTGTDTHRPNWLNRCATSFQAKKSVLEKLRPLLQNSTDLAAGQWK